LSNQPSPSPVFKALRRGVLLGFFCLLCGLASAFADVGVILNETLDESVARITGSGHTAVYFSNICPESPIKLRLCHTGETGSVISNYITLGEDQPFEWNVVPLNVYLYGVEDTRNRPMFGSPELKRLLEERYREKYLNGLCEGEACRTSNKSEWREMVAATLERSLYIFVIKTTVAQDEALIADFNSAPNENHFNGVTRNCADFTRRIINTYFPKAVKGDYINDFGMTSPKAIARSFSKYAHHHPDVQFRVYHFTQAPGSIKRSTPPRTGTEQLYRSKKLLVPMLAFAPHELGLFAASYWLTGRFNPQRELEHHPAMGSNPVEFRTAASGHRRAHVLGSSDEWKDYRNQYDAFVHVAVNENAIPDRDYLSRVLKRLDGSATPVIDENGALWLESYDADKEFRVGLSASNILASESDPRIAYGLILARTGYQLRASKHSRENMVDFRNDWAMLQAGQTKSAAAKADSPAQIPAPAQIAVNPRIAAVSGGP
jgi:hypothetical protein